MKIVSPKTVPPPPDPLTATAAPPASSSAAASGNRSQTGSAQTGGPARTATPAQRPTSDSLGAKVDHDPLVRLRDSLIQTSAHQSHPTAASAADGLVTGGTLVKYGLGAYDLINAGAQVRRGFAQDGNTFGVHTTHALGRAAVSVVGAAAGAAIGAEIGAAAGAFVGGAFAGVGAVPGAMVGGFIGEFIGSSVGSNMAIDDVHSMRTEAASCLTR